jgi:hypothetical protein
MKIGRSFSHLNGEEYLIVHHKVIYDNIKDIITSIDSSLLYLKESKEKRSMGKLFLSPIELNRAFKNAFESSNWLDSRYNYYITLDRDTMLETIPLEPKDQKALIESRGEKALFSYNQTDFVKDSVAVEVQFGKYAFVAFDLFVKHMMFYSAGKINVGIEILPMKVMQEQMSSGVAYYEGEVYNVMRSGRSNPPVPLWIIGIEP